MNISRAVKFLNLALEESKLSTYHRVKIGAVITQGNRVLSKGANLSTSHPVQAYWDRLTNRRAPAHNMHAEMNALVRAKRLGESLEGATIYIARLDRNNQLNQCRPCDACMAAIEDAGIHTIVHTTQQELLK